MTVSCNCRTAPLPAAYRLRLRLGLDQRVRDHRGGPWHSWDCRHYGLGHAAGAGEGAFVPLAEDHFSCCRLQHRRDRYVDGFADHFPCVVHDHHGAVIEIGDTLVVFLTFFEDEDLHDLAGQHDGLERVRQLVNVQYFDALQLRDFVQIEVVGDDLAFVDFGQLDQLEIHFADGGEIVFHDLDLQRGHFLQALQNVEAAAAAVALQRVGRIGHELQFAQHELRSNDDAVEEAGLGNVGDAAVDDDAGVEDLVALLALLFATKHSAQRCQVQQVAFARTHNQAHVCHQQHDQDLKKALGAAGRHTAANHQRKQVSPADAEDAPDGRADQPFQAHSAQLPFEQNYPRANQGADSGVEVPRQSERSNDETSSRNYDDKKKTYKNQIHSYDLPRMQHAGDLARCTGAISSPPQAGIGKSAWGRKN